MEAVAGLLGDAAFRLHPARAAARHVSRVQVGLGERLASGAQFLHGLGKLDAGGPGFVHAGAGQDVGAAGTLADARVSIARQKRLAALARLLQRLGAPGAQLAAFEIAPEIRMQHVVLEIAIGRAYRIVEPGRHEDADGSHAAGMHIEEAEDLRLRVAECMEDRAGLQIHALAQIHHHLCAHGPLMLMVAAGQAEEGVELAAHSAHGSIAHYGERGVQVHAGHVARIWVAFAIGALIEQPHAYHAPVFHQRFGDGHAGPDLDCAGVHGLRAGPLHELADGEEQSAIFVQEGRGPGQLESLHEGFAARQVEQAQQLVGRAQGVGAAAGPDGIEQVGDLLLAHWCGHGDFGRIEIRETGADAARARHCAGDAEADVVGALVADDLQVGVGVARQRGQEAAHGRPEADAGDIHVHR